jgi:uncharacterized membrane protein
MQVKRYNLYLLFSTLILLCKEDAAFTVFALAGYVFFKGDRRWGMRAGAVAIVFFIINMTVLLPFFNGFGYFRFQHGYRALGKLGASPQEAVTTVATNPQVFADMVLTEENGKYIFEMYAPLLFSSVLGWEALLISAPSLAINLGSGYYYTHFIKYHYSAYIIPVAYISAIIGLAKLQRFHLGRKRFRFSLALPISVLIIFSTAYGGLNFGGPLHPVKNFKSVEKTFSGIDSYSMHAKVMRKMVGEIPREASISVSYNFLTNLAHREKIYMFTTPFKPAYWGINGENLPDELPDYLLLDTPLLDKHGKRIYRELARNGTYVPLESLDGIVLMRKNTLLGY